MHIVTSFFVGQSETPWQWNFKWMKDALTQFDKSVAAVLFKQYQGAAQVLISNIRKVENTLTITGEGGAVIQVNVTKWKKEVFFKNDDVTIGFITLYSKKPKEDEHE